MDKAGDRQAATIYPGKYELFSCLMVSFTDALLLLTLLAALLPLAVTTVSAFCSHLGIWDQK